MAEAGGIQGWFDRTFRDLARQLRWSFLPPLMVYFAAGIAALTSIVGAFFVKDHLDLSAAFLAGLAFWAGLPWVLKMPLGHLVDLIWRRKALLVYLGAALIGVSMLIMYGLVAHTAAMKSVMAVQAWYVLAALLAPVGYVVQDVVADAMTVEAVPAVDENGKPFPEDVSKTMHTTMQTLGRFAIISGLVGVASLNIFMFSDAELLSEAEKVAIYARIYLMALAIPAISVSGVILGGLMQRTPQLCALMSVAMFSSLGLPGLNGFIGEILIFKGAFGLVPVATALAALGLLVTAAVFLRAMQKLFSGPLAASCKELPELTLGEKAVLVPVTLLMLALGIAPQFMFSIFNTTVVEMSKLFAS